MKITYTLDGTDRYEMEISNDSELYHLIMDKLTFSIAEENDG